MSTLESVVDKAYDLIFKYMCEEHDTDIQDITIEVQTMQEGKTVRRSYADREFWLSGWEKQT